MIYTITAEQTRELSPGVQAKLVSAAIAQGLWYMRAGAHPTPKLHLAVHLSKQCAAAGNCKCYSNYEDESHLADVRRLMQSGHRYDFEARMLCKLWMMDTWI